METQTPPSRRTRRAFGSDASVSGPAPDSLSPSARPHNRSVVAVVITDEPSSRFDRTLRSLAAQDHALLTVLVVDASGASAEGFTDRVAGLCPGAYVKRTDQPLGWAAAANSVIDSVGGAGWFLFCHDDVDLAPDAISLLVDQAHANDAVAATPKLLSWADHERLLGVGIGVDRTARLLPTVDRQELDQHQRDGIRDVAAGSSACLLVNAEAFTSIGGFDALTTPRPTASDERLAPIASALGAPELGEDVDLCWRLRVAGGRIIVVSDARVAHGEDHHFGSGVNPAEPLVVLARSAVARRNRLRTVIVTRGRARLLPGVLTVLAQGLIASRRIPRRAVARAVPDLHLGQLSRQRKAAQRLRLSPDRDVDRLLVPVLGRLRTAVGGGLAEDGARAWWYAQRAAGTLRSGPGRIALAVAALVSLVLVVGSRGLFSGGIPEVGAFPHVPGPSSLVESFFSGYRHVGVGDTSAAPPGLMVVALASLVTLGREGLAMTLLSVGMIGLGVAGVWQLTRSVLLEATHQDANRRGSSGLTSSVIGALGGAAAAVGAAANPLTFTALARGRWEVLVPFGVLPWLLRGLFSYAGLATKQAHGGLDSPPPVSRTTTRPEHTDPSGTVNLTGPAPLRFRSAFAHTIPSLMLPVIVPAALATAVAPSTMTTIVLAFIGVVISVPLWSSTQDSVSLIRNLVRSVLATVVGIAVLLGPWTLQLLRRPALFGSSGRTVGQSMGEILKFHPWPGSGSTVTFLLPIIAALGLLVVDGSRFDAVIRCWGIAVVSLLSAWGMWRFGWADAPSAGVLLVPAAIAVSVAIGITAVAIVTDVQGSTFGWRQVVALIAVGLIGLSFLPRLWAARQGRWMAPHSSFADSLRWLPERAETDGSFRVMWLGNPEVLPASPWLLDDELGLSMSRDATPDLRSSWPGAADGHIEELATDLASVRARANNRLGSQLALFGIRYVALVERRTPGSTPQYRVPFDLRRALDTQLDLRQVELAAPGLTLYENTDWVPIRSMTGADGSAPEPVLLGRPYVNGVVGDISRPGRFTLIESAEPRWRVRIDGREPSDVSLVATEPGPTGEDRQLGVTASVEGPGRLSIQYRASLQQRVGQFFQVAVWVAATLFALQRWRLRRRRVADLLHQITPPVNDEAPVEVHTDDIAFLDDAAALTQLDDVRRAKAHAGTTRSGRDQVDS
jgi:GT2 family glycosyltransferase